MKLEDEGWRVTDIDNEGCSAASSGGQLKVILCYVRVSDNLDVYSGTMLRFREGFTIH